jgi:hypothetical protein
MMKKLGFLFVLCGVGMFSLVGCSDTKKDTSTTKSTNTTTDSKDGKTTTDTKETTTKDTKETTDKK